MAPPVGPTDGHLRRGCPSSAAVCTRNPRSGTDGLRPVHGRATAPVPRLTITCSTVGLSWVLVLCGSLDVGSAVALRSQFEQLTTGEFDRVVVDIDGLTAIDHAGAAALHDLGEHVSVIGAELRLR